MIILDTNVVSEPLKPSPDANVLSWLSRQTPATLFITAVTKAELLVGLEKMPVGRRRDALEHAIIEQVLTLFDQRVLPFDSDCALPFAKLVAAANRVGNSISFPDAAIAAIAITWKFQVATRNADDFIGTGVKIINPWLPVR
jgi:toxin FitB